MKERQKTIKQRIEALPPGVTRSRLAQILSNLDMSLACIAIAENTAAVENSRVEAANHSAQYLNTIAAVADALRVTYQTATFKVQAERPGSKLHSLPQAKPKQYIGTAYFVSLHAAYRYYRPYGTDKAAVDQKIAEGEIHIGKPPLQPGDVLTVIDEGTRYQIGRP